MAKSWVVLNCGAVFRGGLNACEWRAPHIVVLIH